MEASASLKDFAAIEEILIHFWSETGIPEFEMERNYSIIHQIELFMIFLKLTRVIVDLGYSNKVLNDNILYGIGHIFAPIMEEKIKEDSVVSKEKVFEKNGLNQKYWSMRFMKKIIESSINNKQEEIEAILHQTTNIFMIFTKIRINLQIIK